MPKFNEGDRVFVPNSLLGRDSAVFALLEATVERVKKRSIWITPPGGESTRVASALVHHAVQIAIYRIGDFQTELALLDPLLKSILHFCRLLLPEDALLVHEVRSLAELHHYQSLLNAAESHVILIGHGRKDAIQFGVDSWRCAGDVADALFPSPGTGTGTSVLSLCCKTGYREFSQRLSRHKRCLQVIAPFTEVHGVVASQFCQTLFSQHLLEGKTPLVAFKKARAQVALGASFRIWRDGALVAGAARLRAPLIGS